MTTTAGNEQEQQKAQLTAADRLARLKQIVSHVMDMWPVVLKRRTYMQAIGRNEELHKAFGLSYASHIHNAFQDLLLADLIIQIGALILDNDRSSASVARAVSALRDQELLKELRAEYQVVPPAARLYNDGELDEATRAAVAELLQADELRRNLEEFDSLCARLPWIESAVFGSDVATKLRNVRNKAVAHYDIVRDGADWKLWRIGGTGLTYGDIDAYIEVCTAAVDTVNLLVRRASYQFGEVGPIGQRHVDEYIDALLIGLRNHRRAEEERRAELKRRSEALRAKGGDGS